MTVPGFDDNYSFVGFITSILYNLIPMAFLYQLKHKVIKLERVSIISLLSLYCNGQLYFFVSLFHGQADNKVKPMDYCNLVGFLLGLIYVSIYLYIIYYEENAKKFYLFMLLIIGCSGAFIILVWQVIKAENNFWIYFLKYLGVLFNILENLPLGFNIIFLIKNKISEKFTLFGASSGLLNTSAWFSWGLYSCFINEDNEDKPYQTFIANLICILLHITQFFLFFLFRTKEQSDNQEEVEDDNKKDEENKITQSEKKENEEEEENVVKNDNEKSDEEKIIEEFV
jgi:amino acid permease